MPPHWVLDRLYPIANAQLGYFTTRQAEEREVDRRYLAHHVGSSNLERVGRGLYRLRNYPHHRFEDVMATILWVGRPAVASHDSALAIYGLADAMPPSIHVTVDRRFRGSRPGVIVHSAPLPDRDVTRREGVPATTPLRTIADTAADLSVATTAAEEAIERGLVRVGRVRELVNQRPELAKVFERSLST